MNLLRLRDELHRRGFRGADDVRVETADVTGFLGSSSLAPLRQETWELVRPQPGPAPGLRARRRAPSASSPCACPASPARSRWPTQPGRTFAHELAGRVRVIAGLDQPPILFHSEDWPKEASEHLGRLRAAARLR